MELKELALLEEGSAEEPEEERGDVSPLASLLVLLEGRCLFSISSAAAESNSSILMSLIPTQTTQASKSRQDDR